MEVARLLRPAQGRDGQAVLGAVAAFLWVADDLDGIAVAALVEVTTTTEEGGGRELGADWAKGPNVRSVFHRAYR